MGCGGGCSTFTGCGKVVCHGGQGVEGVESSVHKIWVRTDRLTVKSSPLGARGFIQVRRGAARRS